MKRSDRDNAAGVYLVLACFFVLVFASICLLALGVGFVSIGQTRLENSAKLAALGAIQEFVRTGSVLPGTPIPNYLDRADSALSRANFILNQNPVLGLKEQYGNLGHAGQDQEAGALELGQWWQYRPIDGSDPCGSKQYPCFISNGNYPYDSVSEATNAVRLTVQNEASNPLLVPFINLVGSSPKISTTVAAAMVQRCTVFLLDLTPSMTLETHQMVESDAQLAPNSTPASSPGLVVTNQIANPALPVFRKMWADWGSCRDAAGTPGAANDSWRYDKIHWCNMPRNASGVPIARPNTEVDPRVHYPSDYRVKDTNLDFGTAPAAPNGQPSGSADGISDQVYVDSLQDGSYFGPQPFSRIMMAYNIALRSLQAQKVGDDRAALIAYAGVIRDQIPAASEAQRFYTDFGYPIMMTNWSNRGTYDRFGNSVTPEEHPNAVDRGWLPLYSSTQEHSSSNLILAVQNAINLLSNYCPATAQKSIIAAGDGIVNCASADPSSCGNNYLTNYIGGETALVGSAPDSILNQLVNAKVAFSYILDSPYTDPNFIDRCFDSNNTGGCDAGDKFLTIDEGRTLGYGGINSSAAMRMAFSHSTTPSGTGSGLGYDDVAFNNYGRDGYLFRRPVGVMAELAMKTGGQFCPVMSPCSEANYEDSDNDPSTPKKLRDDPSFRQDGQKQSCAMYYLNKEEQAAKCALDTLSLNPFTLVEEAGD